MAKKSTVSDPVIQKLDAILVVLQDLLILEGAKAGIGKEELRRILSVDSNRVSKIKKHVRRAS